MTTLKGQIVDYLLKGATVLLVKSDRMGKGNRIFVKMPPNTILEGDSRIVKFAQFQPINESEPDNLYLSQWYFCPLRTARNLFNDDVYADRLNQLKSEKLSTNNCPVS